MKKTNYLLLLALGAGGAYYLIDGGNGQMSSTPEQPGSSGKHSAVAHETLSATARQNASKKPAALTRLEEKVRKAEGFRSDPLQIGAERYYVPKQSFLVDLRKSTVGAQTAFKVKDREFTGRVIMNNRNADDSQWIFAMKLEDFEDAVLTIQGHQNGVVDGAIRNRTGSVAYRVDANTFGEDLSFQLTTVNSLICGTAPEVGLAGTHALPKPTAAQTEAAQSLEQAPSETPANAYALQSSPGSGKIIYLNFEGETVSGTRWNAEENNGNDIVCAVDASISSSDIQQIWEIVAEDFKPFDVNVTTDRAVYDNAAQGDKMMTIFTTTSSWYGSAGGVAYRLSFGTSNYCCFVFTNNLSQNSNYAVAASHEVGHTFGLTHDGTNSEDYYDGHGSGYNSWGPIMGAPYGINLQVWDNGTYSGANNFQEDYQSITGYLTARADDASGTVPMPFQSNGNKVDHSAYFNVAFGDAELSDRYSFVSKGGVTDLTVVPTTTDGYGNLDLKLKILDSGGATVAEDTGAGSLSASISTNLAAGTYTAVVETTEVGGSTGYSKYGQVGTYSLSGYIPQDDAINADVAELNLTSFGGPGSGSFKVFSVTGVPLNYTISENISWLTLSPSTGSVTSEEDTISFSYDISGLSGTVHTGEITVTDSKNTTLVIPVTLTIGAPTNDDGILINDYEEASPYPSVINVSNAGGKIISAKLRLNGFSHTFPSDLRMLLESPAGQKIQLMNKTGGGGDAVNMSITFDDAGANYPSNLASAGSGVYKPDTRSASSDIPNAPARPYSTSMSDLEGHSPNGDWKLYIYDDAAGDDGSLTSWTLLLETDATVLETTGYAINAAASSSFDFSCTPGNTYVLEASPDMSTWTTLQTMTPSATSASVTFTPPAGDNQFFRVRETN